jgi:hypothetical protein
MLLRIPIPCPECHQTVKVRTEYIGLGVQCNRCGRAFAVPRMLAVACPECGLRGTFRSEDLGRVVRCNRCDAVYEALAVHGNNGVSNPAEAASVTPERSEPDQPLLANGEPLNFTASSEADQGEPRDQERNEALSELDQLRVEAESLRMRAAEADRLRAECEALKEQAQERAGSEESLRIELEEFRSQLQRLGSEAAALRDGAASAERLEHELRAASEEVTRLRADCQDSRAAAVAAIGEAEALLAQSSTLQDGFLHALAEIEAHSSERLIPSREGERLQARLNELESQVAEAQAARRAVEEDAARALQGREAELGRVREELQAMQTQMRELAELEAEEHRLRTVLPRERNDHDEVLAELAVIHSTADRSAGRQGAGSPSVGAGLEAGARRQVQRVALSTIPVNGLGVADRFSSPSSPAVVSAPQVDLALEQFDLREFLPQRDDSPAEQLLEPVLETPTSPDESDIATGPVADRSPSEQPKPAESRPLDIDLSKVNPHRLKAEITELIFQGRKKEAEVLSRQMVELIRTITGELSRDFSTWITVVGQLQAEQGDLAGARSTFDRKNAIFRDEYGKQDPRYLTCVANSAEALLACGDFVGARVLFEEVEAVCVRTFDAAHPFPVAIRQRLAGLRGRNSDYWTVHVST